MQKIGIDTGRILTYITDFYIVCILTVFLFYCGPLGYQDIFSAKLTVFYLLTGAYTVVCIVLLVLTVLMGQSLPFSFRALRKNTTPAHCFILLYLIFTGISSILSPYAPYTWFGVSRGEGLCTILLYCTCFFLVSTFGKIKSWLLPFFAVTVFLFDIICILQLHGYNPFSLYPEDCNYFDAYSAYPGAYLGTIGNVDLAAGFLCITIPVLWGAFLRTSHPKRILLLIPLGTSLYVLLRMWVLAGLVGVLFGGILSLPVVIPASAAQKKRLFLLILFCIFSSLILLFLFDPGSGLFHELHELLHGRVRDTFGTGRLYIWKQVLSRIPQHLWLGSGPDTMLLAKIPPFSRFDPGLNLFIHSEIDVAHNEYLNILFHQGIFALLSYLAALMYAAFYWIRYSAQNGVIAVLGSAMLCYCIQAFFGFSMCLTAPFFWIVFALLIRQINCCKGEQL